jgi:NAD-dependent dihydropyrimidine dehydrogenase PreA subunit
MVIRIFIDIPSPTILAACAKVENPPLAQYNQSSRLLAPAGAWYKKIPPGASIRWNRSRPIVRAKEILMAYVIAEPCIGTKDTACVDVCPVDCIHPRKDEPEHEKVTQLYINPTECIDCGACVPVCPVTAIFALEDLPEKWNSYTPVNADFYTAK